MPRCRPLRLVSTPRSAAIRFTASSRSGAARWCRRWAIRLLSAPDRRGQVAGDHAAAWSTVRPPVENGVLATWDTDRVPSGDYLLMLRSLCRRGFVRILVGGGDPAIQADADADADLMPTDRCPHADSGADVSPGHRMPGAARPASPSRRRRAFHVASSRRPNRPCPGGRPDPADSGLTRNRRRSPSITPVEWSPASYPATRPRSTSRREPQPTDTLSP